MAGVLIGVGLTAGILRWREPGETLARAVSGRGRRTGSPLVLAVAVTAVWLLPAITTDSIVGHSGFLAPSQIPTHAEDYLAVVNGRTPLVDYIGQYASLLPLLIAPLLSALGSSLTAFTVLMTILSAVAMLAIFGVLQLITRRPWVALGLYIPFVALSLFPWHDQGSVREFAGNYFALFPDRIFGPFILAYACALLLAGRRIPMWSVFLLGGLALINNAEFGVGALVALVVALALGSERSEPLRERAVRMLAQGAIGIGIAVAIVCVVTLIRAGELPDPCAAHLLQPALPARGVRAHTDAVARPALGDVRDLRGRPAHRRRTPSPRGAEPDADGHARLLGLIRADHRHVLRRPLGRVPAHGPVPGLGPLAGSPRLDSGRARCGPPGPTGSGFGGC